MPRYIKDSTSQYFIYLTQGETFSLEISMADIANWVYGDYTYEGVVKRHPFAKAGIDMVFEDGVEGGLIMMIDNSDTEAFTEEVYIFDVMATKVSDDSRVRVASGKIFVENSPTV